MSQPDFTENTDLSAIVSPEDLAAMEAKTQEILAKPLPTRKDLEGIAELRETSSARIEELMAAPGEHLAFDLSTMQGHIDAVEFTKRALWGMCSKALDTSDPIELNEIFSDAASMWGQLPEKLQFNVLLDFTMGLVKMTRSEQ